MASTALISLHLAARQSNPSLPVSARRPPAAILHPDVVATASDDDLCPPSMLPCDPPAMSELPYATNPIPANLASLLACDWSMLPATRT